MKNKETVERKPRDLEGLGHLTGKDVYMELRGEEPLCPERREIYLKGKMIDSNEANVNKKTITIEIPLSHLASISKTPIIPENKDKKS